MMVFLLLGQLVNICMSIRVKQKPCLQRIIMSLNEMSETFERIKNFNVSVKELKDNVLFLRKLVEGGSEHSFGIHVAKMAGMPQQVIHRANKILKQLEKSHSKRMRN